MASPHLLLLVLRSIARLERAGGVRAPRLTEPEHTRWHRFRRKLGWCDLIELLCQDLAGAFPLPFDLSRFSQSPLWGLTEEGAEGLIREACAPDSDDSLTFLRNAARAAQLTSGGALADLPRVQPYHKVLELPGTGGRIAAYQVLQGSGLALHEQFTLVADSDAERVLIGLAAVELRANEPKVFTREQLKAELSAGARFDRVFGLKESPAAVELGGQFPEVRLV